MLNAVKDIGQLDVGVTLRAKREVERVVERVVGRVVERVVERAGREGGRGRDEIASGDTETDAFQ